MYADLTNLTTAQTKFIELADIAPTPEKQLSAATMAIRILQKKEQIYISLLEQNNNQVIQPKSMKNLFKTVRRFFNRISRPALIAFVIFEGLIILAFIAALIRYSPLKF